MNSNFAISVKNLTKIYKIYSKPIDRLKETLNPFKKNYHSKFAALNSISFDIPSGQTLGIIGKNGSGKSTLLKILTGVLTQTSGQFWVSGKISALLELGAGFNPEFSGMDNIYLSCSIMGFSQKETSLKIQSILDFADIGDFIHQPVKTYSSGMHVRLAFAIAIAIEPRVLIVDEALAVGDIRFQQKCLRKMREIKTTGCTILFVSHDVATINAFCDQVIWIEEGTIKAIGPASEVTKYYTSHMTYEMDTKSSNTSLNHANKTNNIAWTFPDNVESFGDGGCRIKSFRFVNASTGSTINTLSGGEDVELSLLIEIKDNLDSPIVGFYVNNRIGVTVFGTNSFVENNPIHLKANTEQIVAIRFKFPHLCVGQYLFTAAIADGTQSAHTQKHWIHDFLVISVENPAEKYHLGGLLVLNENVTFSSQEISHI